MRLVFDVETDGLCRNLSVVHCLVTQDIDTGEMLRYDDSGQYESITTGINMLMEADELIGHNIIQYDFEALKELYPFFEYKGKITDTLILSRLLFTDLLNRDFRAKPANMPAAQYGRHSLSAWGYRLGKMKSLFGDSLEGDWSTYSPEMLEYCCQDVSVSTSLAKMFESKREEYARSIDIENRVAKYMAMQETLGWPFDVDKAHKLEGNLRKELEQISDEMRSTFVFVDGGEMTPKVNNSMRGYVKGAPFTKLRSFNPCSRQHIAWAFQTFRGWEPTEFTNTGIPKIDHEVLKLIGTPEALKFSRILELQKHLGMLSEGQNAWLKRIEKDGRIHHSCVLNTNTGRQIHMRPNLSQTPSGHEYRELFHPGEGRIQVGADASGLELRCMAHFIYPYDQGAFATEVVDGDIHSKLATIYGKSISRSQGKGITYSIIYGGGNNKVGSVAGYSGAEATKEGKRIRKALMDGLTGFAELSKAINKRAESDVLKGLDGRPIRIQGKKHAAMNYIFQSAGACICKLWLITAYDQMTAAKLDWKPLGFIHDEVQLSVAPEDVEQVKFILTSAMLDVKAAFNFRCELAAEATSGANWGDTH